MGMRGSARRGFKGFYRGAKEFIVLFALICFLF